MNKTGIIIHREYTTRVRKKSFVLMTILMPLLFIGLMAGTMFLAQIDSGESLIVPDEPALTSIDVAPIIGMIFTFLIYTFILIYGVRVMQSVMEEKNNRIIEIMVSSVKPVELMMGKLIGVGLVGLTQFAIWGVLIGGVIGFGGVSLSGIEGANLLKMSLFFIIFFICGYWIYASLFAAVGALVSNPEDAQQFIMPITVIVLFALYSGMYSAQNPDGALAFWSSLFPLTSPIVMMTRLAYGIPWWQLLLSIVLLVVTAILMVKMAAKIYRTGILMYGKKPAWKEIIKWLKY
jgi:ABC-2 type transport system permease protein